MIILEFSENQRYKTTSSKHSTWWMKGKICLSVGMIFCECVSIVDLHGVKLWYEVLKHSFFFVYWAPWDKMKT